MKKLRKSILLMIPFAVGVLAACTNGGGSSSSTTPSSQTPSSETPSSQTPSSQTPSSQTPSSQTPSSSTAERVNLNMAVGYQPKAGATNMKFISGAGALADVDSYVAADGNTYVAGDFKPVWRQVQTNLSFTINDITGQADSSVKNLFSTIQGAGFKSQDQDVHVLVGNGDQIVNAGNAGNLVDLASHLSEMPNFSKFLEDNPAVKQIITSDPVNNKGIYYSPYFDGYDDIERTLLVRKDWVVKLLDGETAPNFDTGKTLNSVYTTFNGESVSSDISVVDPTSSSVVTVKKSHEKSIITTQNEGAKTGAALTQALRDYIDATYKKEDGTPFYGNNRSELFVGSKAAYDVDELVALFRCVLTNPNLLVGDSSAVLVPFFPRESGANRYADYWRFLQFFGVRGAESRNGFLYVGSDNKLHDARTDGETVDAVLKMNEMYQEGLLLQNFGSKEATSGNNGKYNADLLTGNRGFASYDYVQTQTIYNDNAACKKIEGFEYVPTMPAVVDWDGNGKQYHYTESWRSVKPQGWCITTKATGSVLTKALQLFDYFYSEEGNKLMSYGPEAWVDGTFTYQGQTKPKLSEKALTELSTLAGGNYTNYYRYWLGGTFPIGYVKEQAMEYQCTSAKAQVYLNQINLCIEKGTLTHVNHLTTNTNVMLDIVPATLAYNSSESEAVAALTEMSEIFGVESGSAYNVWGALVRGGWSAVNEYGTNKRDMSSKEKYLSVCKETLKIDEYLTYVNDAYARMGMIPKAS